MQPPFVRVKPRAGVKILATHTLPATVWIKDTDRNEQAWVNWEPPPPGEASESPAIVSASRGKGKIFYISFDLYGMVSKDFHWPLELHHRLLRSSVAAPPLRVDLENRSAIGTTFYKKRQGSSLIIHQVNRTVSLLKGEVAAISGGMLVLNKSFHTPTSYRQIHPTEQDLHFISRGDFVAVQLPEVAIHSVIVLKA